jgi:23S rRNA (cytosine1962-C5)-methyltransferase
MIEDFPYDDDRSSSAPGFIESPPRPMVHSPFNDLPKVRLKIERKTNHPWIFQKPAVKVPNGAIVDVVERGGSWVGRGIYNSHSRISLRILTAKPDEAVDAAFFADRIGIAMQLRRDVLKLDEVTDAYRVVHSEADGLSGLVVDRFGDLIVIEYFSAGMFKQRAVIQQALLEHFPNARFYYFAEEHVGKQESFDCRPPTPPAPITITEHGLKFRVQPGGKHKTGFFVDQRENRQFLSTFTSGKRVLDICCNSGGFSVYAKAKGNAAEVIGIDLDEEVLELAKHNAKLNRADVRYIQSDLFPWLRDAIPNGQRFDTVILDPAKMTRDRDDVMTALRKYADMNRLAMQVVSPGGMLLTCSCTGLISEADFVEMLRRASWQAGRQLQIFRISGAASDHPYFVHVPEGRYLKAVFARVF